MGRKLLWASLVLAPITLLLRFVFDAGDTTLFVASAASLVPLAWMIGEATEQAGEHTGPGIGGFLNASFGNAPELIIALFAVNESLPDVVRGSLAGSVVSNILLVLGVALIFGGQGGHGRPLDRFSLLLQLGLVLVATVLFLVPSVPGWTGDPERHNLAVLTIPVAIVLLVLYGAVTRLSLRRHKRLHEESGDEAAEGGWSFSVSLVALGAATLVTALISETLVHSLHAFAESVGLSQFFIAAVIVAIVGNAAEHGGAIVIASRGKLRSGDRDRRLVERAGGAAGDPGGGAALVARAAGAAADVPAGRAGGDGRRGRARGVTARRRPGSALGRLPARRRLRRRGVRLLRRRRPLGRRAEDLGRARERVGRPVELHDLTVLVPHHPQRLAALAA